MTKIEPGTRIYTVVEVVKGVAMDAHNFRQLKDALLCAERLREGRDLQEDDVQLFESGVDPHCRKKK